MGAANIGGSRLRIPLSFYLFGLLTLFGAVAGGSALLVRAQATQAAEESARVETQFAADQVGADITAALIQLQATVTRTASSRDTSSVFAGGSQCNVGFRAIGLFSNVSVEFVTSSGRSICSSGGPIPAASYAGATWLADALGGPVVAAPITDPRTGRVSLVSAAPAGDLGVVAAFADLTDLGTTLAARPTGTRQLEFIVTTFDGKTVLARSWDPGRWAGAAIDGTAFATASERSRPDLDNVLRLYGEASAGDRGWRVFAGADQATVVSEASTLFQSQLVVASLGLLALLVGTLFVYRAVVGPVRALSRSVNAMTDPASVQPARVTGPSEIAQLAQDFNELIITVMAQLADREHAAADARALIDAALDAVVGMDQDGKVIEWSRQAETTFGWPRAEAMGRPLVSLIVPERYQDRHTAGLAEYVRSGVGPVLRKRIELEACTRDGREIPVELAITPAETPSGHVFTAFIRDLSTRRSSEQERLTLEERLRQSERLEGIGRLAGGIAHDFNNILAVVMNYSQFVEDSLPEGSDMRDDVVQIRLAAERGATFTRQLLTFAHRGAVNPQDVQLNTVLGELRTMLRRTIPKSVTIDLSLAPDLWTVRMDVGQLEQLLLNLIVNAADAMPDGGTALIKTSNVEFNGEIQEPNLNSGRYVRLEVTDTGYGMSKDVIARAFEPFFTTKAKGKGTGLGLATAYGIVQQAKGAISIQSVVGRGTTVRVHVPAQVGAQPEAVRLRAAAVPDTSPSKAMVFVVEDEPAVRKAVVRMLSDRGYSVLQAAGPTSAIELASLWSGPVDVLLTDIVMPDMTGDELARELRNGRPQLRVVYMTGYSGERDMAALRIDGPVIHKPFSRDALVEAIEAALAEK
ncbi:MAG: ATP-binding protein [Chloroflexota bacterium]